MSTGPSNRGRGKRASADTQSFADVFGEPSFREPFNRLAANYLRQKADTLGISTDDQKSLEELFKQAGNSDFLETQYAKGKDDASNTGRWFVRGTGLQRLKKKLRATLCKDLWLDLDFVNCGPTLLLELCKKHKINEDNYQALADYVKNREAKLMDGEPYATRDEVKNTVIQMMYGKSLESIQQEAGDEKLNGIEWLPHLDKDFKDIRKSISDEYEEIRLKYKHAANKEAKVMSGVLFQSENACVQAMYHFLKAQGIIVNAECVLTFDGIMVRASDRNRERIGVGFLKQASDAIREQTGFTLNIKHKPFTEGYELPDGFEETTREHYHVIDAGDDQHAADIFLNHLGSRLVSSNTRYFIRDEYSVIYKEGEKAVTEAVYNTTRDVVIMTSAPAGPESKTSHYSKDTSRLSRCIPRILADPSIQQQDFVNQLWQNNLKYLAFTNGVYSFEDFKLLTSKEAIAKQIFFTQDTGLAFPIDIPSDIHDELMKRVIKPFLPDEEQRQFFLNCVARALAGDITDKRWFACIGARNCGKGIFCKLLAAGFGGFVRTLQAENLLHTRGAGQDAAKAQSWMRPHEFTRLLYSNEMRMATSSKFDGEMLKRLCSNGDVIECRKNYENETQIRLQTTVFLFANDLPQAEPADAYQTMQGFKFQSEFREACEITNKSDPMQKNWEPMDHSIDAFIRQPAVIDAFVKLVLSRYTQDIQAPPDIVQIDTKSIKGTAAESQEERFKRLVQYTGKSKDVVFYKEIRNATEATGMGRLSDAIIDSYVKKHYNLISCRPSKIVDGRPKQDRGFKQLILCEDGYDEKAERIKKMEAVKQSVRSQGVITHDRFTPDTRIGE